MAYLKHQIIKFKLLILGMQTDSIYIHLIKWEIILIHLALGKKVNSARDLSRITPFMHFSHAILCHRVILSKESIYIYLSGNKTGSLFHPASLCGRGELGYLLKKSNSFSEVVVEFFSIQPYFHICIRTERKKMSYFRKVSKDKTENPIVGQILLFFFSKGKFHHLE